MARNSLLPFGYGGDPVLSLHREMNRLFDDMFRGDLGPGGAGRRAAEAGVINADMNVSESDKEIRLTVELPGVKPEDVDISLENDILTVRGEKRFEHEDDQKKRNYHFMERSFGSFQRSLRLPFNVRPEDVSADFEHGVLTIVIPKSAQQTQSKKIPIGARGAARPGEQPSGDGEQASVPQGGTQAPGAESPPPMH
jgi:HSP20 family protein